MATKKSISKKVAGMSSTEKVGIGVGLTAAAVAAAGAYFLYGSKNAPKNRKMVKSWALRAKAEVLETLEKAQEMTKEEYESLIDSVAAAYSQVKDASRIDIADFKREMKEHWNKIEKSALVKKAAKGAATGAARGAAKGVVKKTAKKAPAKKAAKKSAPKKTAKKAAKKTTNNDSK